MANQVRLWLFVLAYNLGNSMRRLVLPEDMKHWTLAAYPVILFYAENKRQGIVLPKVLVALGLVLIATMLLVLLLKLIIRDSTKASLIASIGLFIFFAYGTALDLAERNSVMLAGVLIGQDRYLLPTFAVMGLTSVGLVLMYRGSLTKFMQTAAVLTLGLICFNVVHIGVNTLREPARQSGADQSGNVILPPREGTDRLPDIYFIVLDSYGRADVLEEIYDFDNHEFIESLTQKGFFVASGSRSNYITTEPSLAASLNMRYHGEWEDFYSLVQENLVVALAQSFGYKYVHVGSGWLVTMRSTHADVEILYGIRFPLLQSEFMAVLVSKTLASTLGGLVDIRPSDAFVGIVANRFNYNMKQIPDIADLEGPTFTFSHNFPPHPPFVFDRNGNLPQRSKLRFTGSVWRDSDLYIDQLYYVNKTVDAVVEGILKRSPEEPVIIIHGDHGPSHGGNVDFKKPSDSFIFERTGIFSAYYLPEHCRSGLYAAISPVNNFRMVFDSCLGTNFGLSEDKTHWSVGGPPIDFSRIMR